MKDSQMEIDMEMDINQLTKFRIDAARLSAATEIRLPNAKLDYFPSVQGLLQLIKLSLPHNNLFVIPPHIKLAF